MLGVMDGAVLERLAKIMGYMKMSSGGIKGARKLKRREKMRMLAAESGQLPSGGFSLEPSDVSSPILKERLLCEGL